MEKPSQKQLTNQINNYYESDGFPDTTQYERGDIIPNAIAIFKEQQAILNNYNSATKVINKLKRAQIDPTVALNKVLFITNLNNWLKRPEHRNDIINALQASTAQYQVINQTHAGAALFNPKNLAYNLATDAFNLQNNVRLINHPVHKYMQIETPKIKPATNELMIQVLNKYQTKLTDLWTANQPDISQLSITTVPVNPNQ